MSRIINLDRVSAYVLQLKVFASSNSMFYILLCMAVYIGLMASLRYRRSQYLQKKYSHLRRGTFYKMTDREAWEIQKLIFQLEFPFMALKSLQFALFRTYGIPSISSLLVKTMQLSDTATAFKRYADTSLLIGEFVAFEPSSERAHAAIARTNYLHTGYRSTGRILDDDMLYTLSLFALEPIRFVETCEWRDLTDLERCAIGTYWKSLGDALGIGYDSLPSGTKRSGFRDGLHWLEEIKAWSHEYEREKMKPHQANKDVADRTTDILIYVLPDFLKPLGIYFVSFMMDERLRGAMMYDPPPRFLSKIFSVSLLARKYFIRYLSPPRPYFLRYDVFTENPDENGRNFFQYWDIVPYYVKPTLWNRWGPAAWVRRVMGLPLPGDDGDRYYPRGYRTSEVGPRYFEGKGSAKMVEIKSVLARKRRGQCPFA
ncbi:hypothetical protein DTO207G8_868 [Paecilomyces variotii]|nr:hypothetical protein DTO207G8_868 [Paecilomyces variotii]